MIKNKYMQLKNEYVRFENALAERSPGVDRGEILRYCLAAVLRIWAGNVLYSPDYTALLNEWTGGSYTAEQTVTAMACCGDPGRKLAVPGFFKDCVRLDLEKNGQNGTAPALRELNGLLVDAAMINGDFTAQEAEALSSLLADLRGYAASQGLSLPDGPDNSEKVTEKREDSYLPSGALRLEEEKREAREAEKEKTVPAVSIPISITIDASALSAEEPDGALPEDGEEDAGRVSGGTPAEAGGEETTESLLGELDRLVGLGNVKQDIRSLMNFIKVTKIREKRGMKVPTVSYHLVFTGNPGTGKTTVARLVAKLYYHMGVLPQGQLVEADRSALVAGYLGQTALKTQKVIQRAMGGVLFIDEAYSLLGDFQDYGREAVETILKAMEDHRDELVVIVAGYTELMKRFIGSNPGLSSRFNKYFEFPDYTGEELTEIFRCFCRKNGYALDEAAEKLLEREFEGLYAERDEHFGNARTARNLFEKAINAQADRIASRSSLSDAELETITAEDVSAAIGGGK